MSSPEQLLVNNRAWSEALRAADPDFFPTLARQQKPGFLWIGCADSRVPANQIVGLPPGEVFVHRNVANVVVPTDPNCLSVLQFGIEVLRIPHVIVCGHYGCGGVQAAWAGEPVGLVDNWLGSVGDVAARHADALAALATEEERVDRLCELNVLQQVSNLCRTSVVEEAWRRGQELTVHGWIYGLHDGVLRDLGVSRSGPEGM